MVEPKGNQTVERRLLALEADNIEIRKQVAALGSQVTTLVNDGAANAVHIKEMATALAEFAKTMKVVAADTEEGRENFKRLLVNFLKGQIAVLVLGAVVTINQWGPGVWQLVRKLSGQ